MMLSASIQTYIHMLVYVAVKVKSAIATFSTKTKKFIYSPPKKKKLREKKLWKTLEKLLMRLFTH